MSKPARNDALIIGIPSKGRLQENANAFFARAGMTVKQAGGGREYVGRLSGVEGVAVAFLSASEIASRLEEGSIHFGVTGEDLIREQLADAKNSVELVLPLGFGYADVVVAVPQRCIEVDKFEVL
jgi:ATP phosphoribosyltransferase